MGRSAASPIVVQINLAQRLVAAPATAIGINTAVWDSSLTDRVIPSRLRAAGVELLRYPGGSTSDQFHWKDNSISDGQSGTSDSASSFDRFMRLVARPARAQVMITVNYGSNRAGTAGGSAAEAAAWVRYANRVRRDGVKYWEIGNEIYGNGYYGAQWETDLHKDHSPRAYARNALQFIRLMKAADPSVKIGLVVTAPGNWPDGLGPEKWNETVLSTACRQADFVSVHWYAQQPGQESDGGLLAAPYAGTASSPLGIAAMVAQLKALLARYCRPATQIMVTETNSVAYNPGKQTTSAINGLFLLEDYLEWLQNGAANVSWWDLHNSVETGNNNSSSLAGTTNYGDYGILSAGESPEPAADTPFPTYAALQLLHRALTPGSSFVQAAAPATIHTYALRQRRGRAAIALINPAATAQDVEIEVTGLTAGAGTVTSFGVGHPSLTTAPIELQNGAISYTLAPYSAAVVQLSGQ